LLFYKDARVHCVVLKIRARAAPTRIFDAFRIGFAEVRVALRNRPFRAQQRAWASLACLRGSTPGRIRAVLTCR
jgi:hypothetical protein